MTNKLEIHQENPIDIKFANLANYIKIYFNKLHFIPNHITTLSLISGLFSIYLLYKNKYVLSILFFLILYFFDVLDGIYARSYNMITVFGDYYDHIKDFLIITLYILMIIYKCKNRIRIIPYMIVLALIYFGMLIHLGCQEKIYNQPESHTLTIFKKLCKNPTTTIKYTRFFGCGTLIFFIMFVTIISKNII